MFCANAPLLWKLSAAGGFMTMHDHTRAKACCWLWICVASACEAPLEPPSEERADAGGETLLARLARSDERHISLTSVWGAAEDDVWAVGTQGAIVHFDGEHWQLLDALTESNLTGVHGANAHDVWAVGEDIALHWDGTSWSVALRDVGETMLGVWQSAPNDVWMVGVSQAVHCASVRHWDGARWSWTELDGISSLWDVWNSPDNTLWVGGTAVGGAGFLGQAQATQLTRTTYPGGSLRGIWGSANDDVWVAPYQGAMQHWNGTSWTEHAVGPDPVRLLSVSGTAKQDVWAVGLEGLIAHWNGRAWTRVESNTEATLWSVWSASRDNAWAVGGDIMHWDGSQWLRFAELDH